MLMDEPRTRGLPASGHPGVFLFQHSLVTWRTPAVKLKIRSWQGVLAFQLWMHF